MGVSQWLSVVAILLGIAVIGIQFARQSFSQKIAPYRFNERGISTIAFGLLYFLVYAIVRTPVLTFLGVGQDYIASDGVQLEKALVIATLGWCGWLTHNFVRDNDVALASKSPWLVISKR